MALWQDLGKKASATKAKAVEQAKVLTESTRLYGVIAEEKKNSLPYLPKGYSMFGDTLVAAGIRTDSKVYLAVWNLGGARHVELPLPEEELLL